MSVPHTYKPLDTQVLQRTWYYHEDEHKSHNILKVKIITNKATTPTQSTPKSIGMDAYSIHSKPATVTASGGTATISAYILMEPPSDTYAHITSRSSLTFKHNYHVISGVI